MAVSRASYRPDREHDGRDVCEPECDEKERDIASHFQAVPGAENAGDQSEAEERAARHTPDHSDATQPP